MSINKAIRKQEKSHKKFLLILGFIFLILPAVLFASKMFNAFFIVYLIIIELLILITILISINSIYIKYSVENYKLKLKFSKFKEEFKIKCDNVVIADVKGSGANMEVILIINSKRRNKRIKPIDEKFLKKYPYLAHEYYIIKKHHAENSYFYLIIIKGGYHKYKLLDLIYKNCLHCEYSEEAIERIKEYREL